MLIRNIDQEAMPSGLKKWVEIPSTWVQADHLVAATSLPSTLRRKVIQPPRSVYFSMWRINGSYFPWFSLVLYDFFFGYHFVVVRWRQDKNSKENPVGCIGKQNLGEAKTGTVLEFSLEALLHISFLKLYGNNSLA